jgi:uncharacterized protein YceK
MRKSGLLLLSVLLMFTVGGCQLIAIMTSPNGTHKVEKAKVDMSEYKESRFAVIVDYPGKVSPTANLHYKITKAVSSQLRAHLKVKDIVKYVDVARLRNSATNYNMLSVYQIGQYLKADVVIVVTIDDYSLYGLPTAGYYSGSLSVSVSVFDIAKEVKLWPAQDERSGVDLTIEAAKGQEKLADKLSASAAHCVTRDLYDCQSMQYKVLEEKIDTKFGEW